MEKNKTEYATHILAALIGSFLLTGEMPKKIELAGTIHEVDVLISVKT
ncbi:MAG: hypothetical protein ACREVA_00180 [Burkholderiales bacterium]